MSLLKWIGLLLFAQCFLYKGTDFAPSFSLGGFTVTPDRLVLIIIVVLAVRGRMSGKLQFGGLGRVGWYTLLLAVICAVSAFVMGRGAADYYRLFDFHYTPLVVFVLVKSIPHSSKKLELISLTYLALGAYLAINGILERYGPPSLVWPKYILDPKVGIQFERTRGSFASSEALGAALVVTFLFYVLFATRATGKARYWALFMTPLTLATLHGTNQRAAWVALALCLGVLTVARTPMRRVARIFVTVGLIVFLSGVASHRSIWEGTLFSKRQQTVRERLVNNLTTLDMGKANPIFGVGYGNFKTEWPKYFHKIYDDVID